MRDESRLLMGLFLAVILIGVAAVVVTLLRLDRSQVFVLALVLAGGLALALVLVGVGVVLRARRPDPPPTVERHIIKERVLDGRQPPKTHIVTLPGQNPALAGLYPHLLRGAYRAGQVGRDTRRYDPEPGWDDEEWAGQIIEVEPEEG